ncbi:MAG: CPBP family intramembrane metalloprotease [Actinomycetota bacterium]|nr:CPBP family intramembrane metalloprotease [Euzebyales bacterium]MDQ3343445.1 CPBP family intramembrane metalloprotease [Actinomycetota bacterium]MDQ3529219.1 CPBP family intramembrane metalloprotease [Actinomycetota bacterium]
MPRGSDKQVGDANGQSPTLDPAPTPVPWGVLDAIAALVAALVVIVVAGGAAVELLGRISSALVEPLALIVSLLLLGASVLLYVRLRYPAAVTRLFGSRRPNLRDCVLGVGGGVAAVVVITLGLGSLLELTARLFGGDLPTVQQDFRRLAEDAGSAPLLLFSAAVCAPLGEELFFRGLLYQGLQRRWGTRVGILVSALVFALSHAQQGSLLANAVVVGVILPLGLFLAWIFQRRQSLLVPILVHGTYNLIQVVLLIAGPDGQSGV